MVEAAEFEISAPSVRQPLLLDTLRGEESLGRPFRYELMVLCESPDLAYKTLLGESLCVKMDLGSVGQRYFHGRVASLAYSGIHRRLFGYRIVLRPWIWFLGQRGRCAIYQDKSVPDILAEVFRAAGFSDFERKLSESYSPLDYCVQYNETDLDFVTRLMERAGLYYYVKHEAAKHTIVLCDTPNNLPDIGKAEYDEGGTSERPVPQRIRSWSAEWSAVPGSVALESFDFERPRTELLTRAKAPAGHALDDGEVYRYAGSYAETEQGTRLAQTQMQAYGTQFLTVGGSGDLIGLEGGRTFTLQRHPRDSENGDYLITAARYRLANDAPRSGDDEPSPPFECDFEGVGKATRFRLDRVTPAPLVAGPQTAIVVGKKGEEIWTDKYGRVRLQFHWDRDGKQDEKSSCWVRVAQTWAGAQWGGVMLPRIGQEVIVDFLNGDPDQPIVTGRVYNGDNMPPYGLPAKATQSGIKSRSSKGGGGFNELRFEDAKDKEEVFLQAQKDLNVKVLNDTSVTVAKKETRETGEDRSVEVKGEDKLKVGKGLTVTVGADAKLSADKKVDLEGGGNVTVKSGAKLQLEGASEVTLKCGQASITLKPSGQIDIKGMKITVNGSANVTLKSSGQLALQGTQASLKGSAMLDLQASGIASLRGSLTKIG